MKKLNRYNILWLLSLIVLVFFIGACKPKPKSLELAKIKFEYSGKVEFPKFDKLSLGVYTISEKAGLTAAACEKILKNFSAIAGDNNAYRLNENEKTGIRKLYLNPKDPSSLISFNLKNGDFTYNGGMAQYLAARSTPDLIKADRAVEIARSYIKKLEIPVNGDELVVAHVGGVNAGLYTKGKSTVYEKFTTIRFERKLNGIPVFGHSRIVVQMAEKGKLNTIISQWAPLNRTEIKTEEIIKPEELKDQIEKSILIENTETQRISIESIKVVYYDNGSGILEPAVLVQGKTYGDEKGADGKVVTKEFPYDTVIPLLKSPKLSYPFNHEGLEKRPGEKDVIDLKQENRKSDDDLRKK